MSSVPVWPAPVNLPDVPVRWRCRAFPGSVLPIPVPELVTDDHSHVESSPYYGPVGGPGLRVSAATGNPTTDDAFLTPDEVDVMARSFAALWDRVDSALGRSPADPTPSLDGMGYSGLQHSHHNKYESCHSSYLTWS